MSNARHPAQPLEDYSDARIHRRHLSIDDLPTEILSLIFEKVIPGDSALDKINYDLVKAFDYLHQAVVLSSVSYHLRRAALGTPELWKRLSLKMDKPIDALLQPLQTCASRASVLHITIIGGLGPSDAETLASTANVLVSPEISKKLEYLDLYAANEAELWIPLLTSFPILNTLIIGTPVLTNHCHLDLGKLSRLTHVFIENGTVGSVILPPSVQVLRLANVPQSVQASLLPRCPNLVACTNLIYINYHYEEIEISSTNAVTLRHLKRLTWLMESGLIDAASVRNVRMPALEHLELYSYHHCQTIPAAVISICQEASATLTTFQLNVMEMVDIWEYNDFYRLLTLPLYNLSKLDLQVPFNNLEAVIRALTPGRDGRDASANSHLSNLKDLALQGYLIRSVEEECVDALPRLVLTLLKKWRVGETSYFRFEFRSGASRKGPKGPTSIWTPTLRKELDAIGSSRQIELIMP